MFDQLLKFTTFVIIATAVSSASASSIGGRLHNGFDAISRDAFAVRVHSMVNQTSSHAYLSTGVAISETIVVTVAQAIENYSVWFVYFGGVVSAEQDFQESHNGVAHSNFNPISMNNNIGVIRLNRAVTTFIPISLLQSTMGSFQVFGYGFNAENQLPTILQTMPLVGITNGACANIYGNTMVTENNFCAVAINDGNVANGDQGGPIIPLFLDLQVTGIISFWGRDVTLPIVFERVSAYNDFLVNFL